MPRKLKLYSTEENRWILTGEENQDAFSAFEVGGARIEASEKQDTLIFEAGEHVDIAPGPEGDRFIFKVNEESLLGHVYDMFNHFVGEEDLYPLPEGVAAPVFTTGLSAIKTEDGSFVFID